MSTGQEARRDEGDSRKDQEASLRDRAHLSQQRRLKQATQFLHKDSADLLPLDSLKRLGTSKDLVRPLPFLFSSLCLGCRERFLLLFLLRWERCFCQFAALLVLPRSLIGDASWPGVSEDPWAHNSASTISSPLRAQGYPGGSGELCCS